MRLIKFTHINMDVWHFSSHLMVDGKYHPFPVYRDNPVDIRYAEIPDLKINLEDAEDPKEGWWQ